MNIEKIILGELERVYATCIMDINDEMHYVVASEGENKCLAINASTLEQQVIWEEPGGTMNIIPVPGRKNEFVATQKFIPTFQAAESRIVHAVLRDGKWEVKPIMTIPYLHRFDLFQQDGEIYFIGGTLCTSKAFKDDWSHPGQVITGKLNEDIATPFELEVVYEGITKNHGFCAVTYKGRRAFMVTGVEGLFVAYPPTDKNGAWEMERLFDHEVSDCAVCDIDGDGELEIATIEKFHGEDGKIYKEVDGEWKVIHEHTYEFGHVVWGGKIQGEAAMIIGGRKGEMELILYTMKDGKFVETLIDNTGGASNIAVANCGSEDIILAANRQIGEIAVYKVTA